MSTPYTPYTLDKAFELLKQRQLEPRSDLESTNAIDILGIVGNICTSTSSNGVRKCQIWLLDESCGSRFVLYESSEITRTIRENIQAGDILRFNRVTLKSFGGSFQFQISNVDQELSWFRLGSVNERLDCKNDSMPKSMITCPERLVEISDWYKIKGRNPPLAPSALPTRKRKLEEVQTAVGLLSHITVCVTCVRSETNNNIRGKRKRRNAPVVFASLMDDSGEMSFIDASGRFLSELKSAHKYSRTTRLAITNVATEHPSNLRGSTTSDIVLVPTETTTVRMITEEKTSNHVDRKTSSVNENATEITVRSGIADICVNGLSLKTTEFSSSSEYLSSISGTNGNFQTAMIYLDGNAEEISMNGVLASPGVLKTLCGSLDIVELSNNEKLCAHSMRFLQDLVQTAIVLDWTLTKDDRNNFEIIKATLHRASD